ncbi:MAG: hypothetical protein PV354_10480, partial [Bartonella sp.]|nr:hypothetical protein [Bartonella sp.]
LPSLFSKLSHLIMDKKENLLFLLTIHSTQSAKTPLQVIAQDNKKAPRKCFARPETLWLDTLV